MVVDFVVHPGSYNPGEYRGKEPRHVVLGHAVSLNSVVGDLAAGGSS